MIICHPAAAEPQLAAGQQTMSSWNLPMSYEIPPAPTHDDGQIKCQKLEGLWSWDFGGQWNPSGKLKLIIKLKRVCFLFGSSQLIVFGWGSAPGSV